MIISILGMSGMNKEKTKKSTAFYNCQALKKESGNYHNATDMLLKNYNDSFYFLGTKKAIEFQKKLLDFNQKEVTFVEIADNNLDDIFEEVFKLISKVKDNETVLLDITHGFRHQPISAIFSATLHKFLNSSNLEVIFAKQIIEFQEYEYIYLTEYIDMTQLSLLLTGFIRTLNFVNSVNIEGLNTLAFEKFSRALLSNDFKALTSAYKNLKATLQQAKTNKKFEHLKELFEKIEDTLKPLENFEKKEIYEKYLILSSLMFNKNYYLLALTYLFEAIRLYCSYSFYKNGIINKKYWEENDSYKINAAVMSFISQKDFDNYKSTYYDNNFNNLYDKNLKQFQTIASQYSKLRKLRNKLTHIDHTESQPNIQRELEALLKSIEEIIQTDILKRINR